jgi:hypothetical protein
MDIGGGYFGRCSEVGQNARASYHRGMVRWSAAPQLRPANRLEVRAAAALTRLPALARKGALKFVFIATIFVAVGAESEH